MSNKNKQNQSVQRQVSHIRNVVYEPRNHVCLKNHEPSPKSCFKIRLEMKPKSRMPKRKVQRLKEQITELEREKAEKNAMKEKIEENTRLYVEMNEKLQMLSQNMP
ncbi:hypothetical protein QVD17_20212 [Tagetes erecta]|uniref:Uncharacterized protein n=1 Tax=Tagetes erecta TaxID=13708 RepID=A0AAD8KPI7_TARER|nr:hypothetical protein QVD17_20212 [Tagetes erecta]